MRIAISFDYDSPAGYRESFGKTHYDPSSDLKGAEALLKVLATHHVKTTFAVVGKVALPGLPPDHCQEQIREIQAAGHEVASHSMLHRFLPPMRKQELADDLRASKEALETCLGGSIHGFIPPFNRPSHFPQKGAFSFSERLGLQGRGRGRQSVGSLLDTLARLGFGWCRISFENSFHNLGARFGLRRPTLPAQPFLFRGLVAVPLHATGFGEAARALVRRHLASNALVTLYAHPNQALDLSQPNDESAALLDDFLCTFAKERAEKKLTFETMREVELAARGVTSRVTAL